MMTFLRRLIPRPRNAQGERALDCVAVGKTLQRYLDGAATAETAALIEAHLDDCLRCGLEADTYRRIKAALASHRVPPPSDSLERLRDFGLELARSHGTKPGSG